MSMQEQNIRGDECLQGGIGEKQTLELQNVLSQNLPRFRKMAYRQLGNAADAEDAVQDALLSAYKNLYQFKQQAQMATWLTTIVINSARMQLRRRPRQRHLSLDEQLGEEQGYSLSQLLSHKGPSPEDACREAELRGHLNEFVSQLSPPLRKAFQLRELEGLSTSEAARILGLPDGTIKARVVRARAKLARLMRRVFKAQPRSAMKSSARR